MGRARYDGIADWYDTEFQPAPLESETWETLVRLLEDAPGALIDIGCGTGAYSAGLAGLGWTVTGVDVSEDMLRRAAAKGVRTVHTDASALRFEDGSFDAAISGSTHTRGVGFSNPVREVRRARRARAPG